MLGPRCHKDPTSVGPGVPSEEAVGKVELLEILVNETVTQVTNIAAS